MSDPKTRKRKQIDKPSLETLENWFMLSWNPMDSDFESIAAYADRTLPSEYDVDDQLADKVLGELGKQLHKCPAQCPEQLRRWCYSQIDRQAARFSKNEKQRGSNKTFRYFQQDGHIQIPLTDAHGQEHIWKIPADFLEQARKLWPVHIRWYAKGKPYVARKKSVISPEKTKQVVFPAHHVYLWFKYPTVSDGDISCCRARNNDFLDWTNGNIYVPAFEGKSVSQSDREFRLKLSVAESGRRQINTGTGYTIAPVGIDKTLLEEWERKLAEDTPGDRDILDCGYRADGDVDLLVRSGCNGDFNAPAKPTRPPGKGPDKDDCKAWFTSALYAGMERGTSNCSKDS
jgi:hypothetical protein